MKTFFVTLLLIMNLVFNFIKESLSGFFKFISGVFTGKKS